MDRVREGVRRPRAMLPGESGQLLPTLRRAGGPIKRRLRPSPPGQPQQVVGRRTHLASSVSPSLFAAALMYSSRAGSKVMERPR